MKPVECSRFIITITIQGSPVRVNASDRNDLYHDQLPRIISWTYWTVFEAIGLLCPADVSMDKLKIGHDPAPRLTERKRVRYIKLVHLHDRSVIVTSATRSCPRSGSNDLVSRLVSNPMILLPEIEEKLGLLLRLG